MVRLFGCDCGYCRPGSCVVEFEPGPITLKGSKVVYCGFFETEFLEGKKSLDDARRVTESTLWLANILRQWKPTIACVELPLSGAKSARAIKSMALASGYSMAVFALLGIELQFKTVIYSPYDTKKVCTGNRHAEKEEMIAAVDKVWPGIDWPKMKRKSRNKEIDVTKASAIADSLCTIITFARLNFGKEFQIVDI